MLLAMTTLSILDLLSDEALAKADGFWIKNNPGSGSFICLRQGYGGTSGLVHVHANLKHET